MAGVGVELPHNGQQYLVGQPAFGHIDAQRAGVDHPLLAFLVAGVGGGVEIEPAQGDVVCLYQPGPSVVEIGEVGLRQADLAFGHDAAVFVVTGAEVGGLFEAQRQQIPIFLEWVGRPTVAVCVETIGRPTEAGDGQDGLGVLACRGKVHGDAVGLAAAVVGRAEGDGTLRVFAGKE